MRTRDAASNLMMSRSFCPLLFPLFFSKRVCLRRGISTSGFFFLLPVLGIACTAEELKQKTVEAFDRYIRVTDAGMDAEFVAAVLSSG